MFTRKTIRNEEWSPPKENVRIDQAKLNEPTLAMIPAISMEKGQEHYKIYKKSVNTEKFVEYLKELRQFTADEKVCIFMDNIKSH